MGSGKKAVSNVWDSAKSVVSDAVGTTTGGIVDLEGGKINTNLDDIGDNFMNSATFGNTQASAAGKLGMVTEVPDMPVIDSQEEMEKKKRAAAETNLANEVGRTPAGLSSTILGGSISTDETILKKRKLLG